jgi:hypothetical protein
LNYKKFATETPSESTNAILIVTNQGSLFTFEAMMNFDKIQQEESSQRLMCFSIDHPFIFDRQMESLQSIMRLLEVMHTSSENLNHNWKSNKILLVVMFVKKQR